MKHYNSDSIYFGNVIYNTRDDGYYFTSNESFEKVGEDLYLHFNAKTKLKEFVPNTTEKASVANLFPLSELIKNGEKKDLTKPMIELYRLKYTLLRSCFKKYKNEEFQTGYRDVKTKEKNK